jgi:hypothetical protein
LGFFFAFKSFSFFDDGLFFELVALDLDFVAISKSCAFRPEDVNLGQFQALAQFEI